MRPDRLERILRDLNARPTRDAARGRNELAAELLARHEQITSRERGFKMMFLKRPALVALVLVAVGIGACTVPTETEVEMGQRLTYTLSSGGPLEEVRQVKAFVEAQPGVEDVSVAVEEVDGGPTTLDLMVWGRGLDGDRLAGRLADVFPVLADAPPAIEDLSTEVRTSVAEKVGHFVFHFDIRAEGTDEEIREQILQQIYESDFPGEAEVDVNTEGDVTTIDMEMTHEGDGVETEDEMVIEVIREDE
jgi:hypothetical protein